jgi:hypothetical protein
LKEFALPHAGHLIFIDHTPILSYEIPLGQFAIDKLANIRFAGLQKLGEVAVTDDDCLSIRKTYYFCFIGLPFSDYFKF